MVRRDLLEEWPLGAVMAQAAHASVAAVAEAGGDEDTDKYVAPANLKMMHKVVYEAKSLEALDKAVAKLTDRGARFHVWEEQPEGIRTALALKPYPQLVARRLCKGFRLFK